MRYVRRELEAKAIAAAKGFPSLILTGPRRAGKTWLLRHLFPAASYYLFEDPDVVARFRHDPQGFLDGVKVPVILDEIQNVPEVFNFVRARIDRSPRRAGQWFLTGSQEAGLMHNVTESMAGRAAVLQLLPMSVRESTKVRQKGRHALARGEGDPHAYTRDGGTDAALGGSTEEAHPYAWRGRDAGRASPGARGSAFPCPRSRR